MSAPIRAAFLHERSDRWAELDALITRASTRRRGVRALRSDDVQRLSVLHRSVSADLATARAAFPGDPLTERLERQISRSGPFLYDSPRRLVGPRRFFASTYWRLVADRPTLLLVATLLMTIPAVVVCVWAVRSPDRASLLLGQRFQGRISAGDLGLSVGKQTEFASEIFVNNIRVSIFVFALGLTCCVGSSWMLMYNGALLGVVVGTSIADGHGNVALALIIGHGVLELSIIVVAAVAGMRMGMAIIRPGNEPRRRVLMREARAAVLIVLGTMPFFVLAGLIEGYFTPAGFGLATASTVGLLVGSGYWALVWKLGRASNGRGRRMS